MHSQLGISHFSTVEIVNVSAIPLLAKYVKNMNTNKPIAVSPDAGGEARVKEFAMQLGTDTLVLKKTRNRSTGQVTVENPEVDLSGRDAILVDDMISSGSSIIAATQALRKSGASRVFAVCSHALLLADAAEMIIKAGVDEIIATNSIPNIYAKVDISSAMAEVLRSRFGRTTR
jgi:ribose-phosphate pyrophosphokinase